ncbi:MAG: TetR/AcrR family transcriptional regulator [Janthinobacterium lividum]
MASDKPVDNERRQRVLDAASLTFIRYGYRKTSMDEVAVAADISRQGLYFYFSNKEDLFREAMHKALSDGFSAAVARLENRAEPIDTRLVGAMDEWVGRHVGLRSADASYLIEKNTALLGNILLEFSVAFEEKLATAIAESRLASTCAMLELSPLDIARTLHACGLGWKRILTSREVFVERIAVAVKLLCPAKAAKRRETAEAARRGD